MCALEAPHAFSSPALLICSGLVPHEAGCSVGGFTTKPRLLVRVASEDALDFVARYVLGVGLDVNAGLGWIWREDSEDDRTGGATDGFEEVFDDGPVDEGGGVIQHRGIHLVAASLAVQGS